MASKSGPRLSRFSADRVLSGGKAGRALWQARLPGPGRRVRRAGAGPGIAAARRSRPGPRRFQANLALTRPRFEARDARLPTRINPGRHSRPRAARQTFDGRCQAGGAAAAVANAAQCRPAPGGMVHVSAIGSRREFAVGRYARTKWAAGGKRRCCRPPHGHPPAGPSVVFGTTRIQFTNRLKLGQNVGRCCR